MRCKYLKIKIDRTFECKKSKKKITLKDCSNCQFKEYPIKSNLTKLKNRTYKQVKLEKERFSLFIDNINKCYFCQSTHKLTWHEIFRGRNRRNSIKYGLCLRMCPTCHRKYQEDKYFNDFWHKKGQAKFEKAYPDLDFVEIFKRNYK